MASATRAHIAPPPITLTLTEDEAFALLAVCGRIGGAAARTSRKVFSDADDSLAVVLAEALGLSQWSSLDYGALEGSLTFTKNVSRADFTI